MMWLPTSSSSVAVAGVILGSALVGARATFGVGDFCIEASTGTPVDCSELYTTPAKEWDCDIRSWTRAPDLMAGHQVPAETRLVLNGTECRDIEGWQVALRMKERAIVKMRNYEVEFPIMPQRKPRNATRAKANRRDWNDIYEGHYGGQIFPTPDEDLVEYQTQLEAYKSAIRNKTLFHVHAHERIVFDTTLELDLPEVSDDETIVDHVAPFSVKVPFTNFPPMKSEQGHNFGGGNGKDEQMLNTETMFEYYHLLRLSNGTVLDIAAGKAGFLTEPHAVGINSALEDKEMKWPVELALQSPRNDTAAAEDIGGHSMHFRQKAPDCDAYSRAEFQLTISADETTITPDQNISLQVHLQRTGNGSEYPAFIDISLDTFDNITYAYDYVGTDQEYTDLTYGRSGSASSRYPYPGKMLLARSADALEQQRKRSEESGGSSYSVTGGRWPVGEGTVRYDFEEQYDNVGDRDGYDFTIDLHIPYDFMPSFQQTFSTIVPQIDFKLATTYLCTREVIDPEDTDLSETEKRDSHWEEWRLPARKSKGSVAYHGANNHRGSIPIHVARPSQLDPDSRIKLRHYSDVDAKAPALSAEQVSQRRPLSDESGTEPIGIAKREEEEHELRHSRYGLYTSERQYQPRCSKGSNFGGCWNKNTGGGGMHTAKLWQRFMVESDGVPSNAQVRIEQVVYNADSVL